jgi:hypothetical protein
VAAASLIQTLPWKERKAKMIACAEKGVLEQVLLRIIPLTGANKIIEQLINWYLTLWYPLSCRLFMAKFTKVTLRREYARTHTITNS